MNSASPAGKFSVSKLFNDLKSQGMRVGKDTLYEYLSHLEDSFLLSTLTVASPSARVRQVNPRKCYPVDPALPSAVSFRASEDVGHLLETAVYLELRRRRRSLAYVATRSGYEVDFLAEGPTGSRELVQVCADLEDPATRQRELRALEEGMRETSCERATLVTLREEGSTDIAGRPVRIVPAWRWLDVVDDQDPSPVCQIAGVTSNEPIDGPGDGSTEPDWEVADPSALELQLRAERSGTGTDRIYTVEVRCSDASGNTSAATVPVTVPHNR